MVLQFCRLDDIDRELPFLFSGWVFGWTLRYKMDFENARITTHRSLRKIQVTQLLSSTVCNVHRHRRKFCIYEKKNFAG